MSTTLTRDLKELSPMNAPGERCHPLQSHSRSGPKKPVPTPLRRDMTATLICWAADKW